MHIKGSLLVAEKIQFDSFINGHSAKNIINIMEVKLFPSAVVTDVIVKFLLPIHSFNAEAYVEVYAPDGVIVFYSKLIEIKNYRFVNASPGMDACFNARFAATEEGIYVYKLIIEEKMVAEYPIFIFQGRSVSPFH